MGLFGLALRVTNKDSPMSLLEMAAREAFVGWTVPSLKLLATWGQWPQPKPRPEKEMELLEFLLTHLLPDLSPEQRTQIMARRNAKK